MAVSRIISEIKRAISRKSLCHHTILSRYLIAFNTH